jgi:hypothetical protein
LGCTNRPHFTKSRQEGIPYREVNGKNQRPLQGRGRHRFSILTWGSFL